MKYWKITSKIQENYENYEESEIKSSISHGFSFSSEEESVFDDEPSPGDLMKVIMLQKVLEQYIDQVTI